MVKSLIRLWSFNLVKGFRKGPQIEGYSVAALKKKKKGKITEQRLNLLVKENSGIMIVLLMIN